MIEIKNNGDKLVVFASIRPPAIYLDHWAVREISSNPDLMARFLKVFAQKGTLLFSVINSFDISGSKGEALSKIEAFLDAVGENWFPLEINPAKVIKAEKEYRQGANPPCFADKLLEAYFPHIFSGRLSLKKTVALIEEEGDAGPISVSVGKTLDELAKAFALFRSIKNSTTNLWSRPPKVEEYVPARPTDYVYNGLTYFMLSEDFRLNRNHIADYFHAVVALAYSDFVLLDKHWESMAAKIKLPRNIKVYSQPKISDFIRDLEAA